MYVYKGLTTQLEGWEDRGWLGVENEEILRRVVARLRRRGAITTLQWIKGHSGDPGNEGADRLAAEGARQVRVDLLPLRARDIRFLPSGMRLATLTQKLAYAGVLEWKAGAARPASERAVHMVQAALAEDLNLFPKDRTIWRNIWGKEMSVKVSCFFWKLMHGAHKVGKYWSNIPGYEQRSLCRVCEVEESMAHILYECAAPGQATLWSLADHALRGRGLQPLRRSLGAILGIPSLKAPDGIGQAGEGKSRLLKIVLSETAFLVWKVRCERVIEWDGDDGRVHAEKQLQRVWKNVINERIRLDAARTNKAWKRRRIPPRVVLDTWAGTLHDEASLPEDWTGTPGVLVGTPFDGDGIRTG
ncbi:hypothetical protein C2E23DRAFT_729714 [Lenzites betulinus]|nr:hypothetical protein C2E23DRAFT_729714 [Lenzites betulinus]